MSLINHKSLLLAVAAVASVGATAGTAKANLISNGSFETVNTSVNQYNLITLPAGSDKLPGWTIGGQTIDVKPNSYWQASDGNYSLDLTGTPGAGSISQTISTQVGKTYIVTFDMAPNPGMTGIIDQTFPRILELSAAGSSETWTRTIGTNSFVAMNWETIVWDFVAVNTSTTITFSSLGQAPFCGMALDNVIVEEAPGELPPPENPIPEPASLGVLALGGLLLLRRRHRA